MRITVHQCNRVTFRLKNKQNLLLVFLLHLSPAQMDGISAVFLAEQVKRRKSTTCYGPPGQPKLELELCMPLLVWQ